MKEDKLNYLSDKELQSLIEEIEQEDMVHAPHNMKQSILDRIESEERVHQHSAMILSFDYGP